jgi:hypothetical protein
MVRVPALNRVVHIASVGGRRIGGNVAGLWAEWGYEMHIGSSATPTTSSPGVPSSGTMSALHVGGGHT